MIEVMFNWGASSTLPPIKKGLPPWREGPSMRFYLIIMNIYVDYGFIYNGYE